MSKKRRKDSQKFDKGLVLAAEPYMEDAHFRRAVILLCDYHKEGAFGFILNKPIEMNITALINDFPDFDSEVYYGGPVQTDTIHYLHTKGDLLPNSVEVLPNVYWGGDFDALRMAVDTGIIDSKEIRFYVGYTGWNPGQLKHECKQKAWIVQNGTSDYVFNRSTTDLWTKVLDDKGGHYRVLAQMSKPNYN